MLSLGTEAVDGDEYEAAAADAAPVDAGEIEELEAAKEVDELPELPDAKSIAAGNGGLCLDPVGNSGGLPKNLMRVDWMRVVVVGVEVGVRGSVGIAMVWVMMVVVLAVIEGSGFWVGPS